MQAYRDTPYYVHNIPYDPKYGRYGFKATNGGQWRQFPGQPMRFYMHRGPYMAARPFVPRARYHSNPSMNRTIMLKHRNAWNKREYARSSAVGNYGMQKRRETSGFDPLSNTSKNFPSDFLPFLEKELKERDKTFASLTNKEAKEVATEAAMEHEAPTQAPKTQTYEPFYRQAGESNTKARKVVGSKEEAMAVAMVVEESDSL